jgi:hypothetical protein
MTPHGVTTFRSNPLPDGNGFDFFQMDDPLRRSESELITGLASH